MKPAHTSILAALLLLAGCGGSDAPSCIQSPQIFAVTNSSSGNAIYKTRPASGATGSTPISGTVVFGNVNGDNSVSPTNTAVPNAKVWLEQQSHAVPIQGNFGGNISASATVENLISAVTADSNGRFTFCVGPSSGNFEIVADSFMNPGPGARPIPGIYSVAGTFSAATVTTGLPAGSAGLVVPLVSAGAVTISGTVTTQQSSSAPGKGDDVAVTVLQSFVIPGSVPVAVPAQSVTIVEAIVPFFSAVPSPPIVTTNPSGTGGGGCSSACPSGANCACYALNVPASNPVVGGPSPSGTGYSASSSSPPSYSIDAQTTVIGTFTSVCSPGEFTTTQFNPNTSGPTTAPTLSFTGCD
jgi:hypothetical protein